MYEQSPQWNAFYCELDPARRWELLEELLRTEPDDGANSYRLLLLEARHGTEKRDRGGVDRFLYQFVNLIQIYRSGRFFRKNARREVLKLLRQLSWAEAGKYGEAGERALYWELRNAAMRYFSTCASPMYNRGLFGMVPSSDLSRRERVRQEVWQMTGGLTERTGLDEDLRIWNRAVADAHGQFEAGAAGRN